jgi:RNA polymerase sigma-70 factor (ECF subfamily)
VVVSGADRELVLAAVNGLPERFRQVVAFRYLLGLSEAETAATLGIPAGTVKSRTARALSRLEAALSGVIEEVGHE